MLRRNADNSIGKCHGSDLPDGLTDDRYIAAPAHHDYARAYGAANTLDTCIQSTLRKRRGAEMSGASARACALRGEKWQLGKLFFAGVVGHAYTSLVAVSVKGLHKFFFARAMYGHAARRPTYTVKKYGGDP